MAKQAAVREISEELVREQLRRVFDTVLGFNIVELGLVYNIKVIKNSVFVRMTFLSPDLPINAVLIAGIKKEIGSLEGVKKLEIETTFNPPWNPKKASMELQKEFSTSLEEIEYLRKEGTIGEYYKLYLKSS